MKVTSIVTRYSETLLGVVRDRVIREAGLALPGWMMARSGFHRGCKYGPRCWRGSQVAVRERPQGPGYPGLGRFGDGRRPGRPARDEPQVCLPADAQGPRGVG